MDKSEHKDDATPDLLESESSSDHDEEPQLSNIVMPRKTVIIIIVIIEHLYSAPSRYLLRGALCAGL